MNLTLDIGNTNAKAAIFADGRIVERTHWLAAGGDYFLGTWAAGLLLHHPGVQGAIVVSTRGPVSGLAEALGDALGGGEGRLIVLDHTTPIPIKNLYATPGTLGLDRLAAAAGAAVLFPGEAALVVDFGTAITYDVVTAAGEFLGGTISPGAATRFRSLHDYTGALPLGTLPEGHAEFPPRDTASAIAQGVAAGIVAETEATIALAVAKFNGIRIIFTGGDADYFAERVNYPIFATSDLVFYGLNAILNHNATRQP